MTTNVNTVRPIVGDEERGRRLHEAYSYLISLARQKQTKGSETTGDGTGTATCDIPSEKTGDAVRE